LYWLKNDWENAIADNINVATNHIEPYKESSPAHWPTFLSTDEHLRLLTSATQRRGSG
jgi:hypothetical protein